MCSSLTILLQSNFSLIFCKQLVHTKVAAVFTKHGTHYVALLYTCTCKYTCYELDDSCVQSLSKKERSIRWDTIHVHTWTTFFWIDDIFRIKYWRSVSFYCASAIICSSWMVVVGFIDLPDWAEEKGKMYVYSMTGQSNSKIQMIKMCLLFSFSWRLI